MINHTRWRLRKKHTRDDDDGDGMPTAQTLAVPSSIISGHSVFSLPARRPFLPPPKSGPGRKLLPPRRFLDVLPNLGLTTQRADAALKVAAAFAALNE